MLKALQESAICFEAEYKRIQLLPRQQARASLLWQMRWPVPGYLPVHAKVFACLHTISIAKVPGKFPLSMVFPFLRHSPKEQKPVLWQGEWQQSLQQPDC